MTELMNNLLSGTENGAQAVELAHLINQIIAREGVHST